MGPRPRRRRTRSRERGLRGDDRPGLPRARGEDRHSRHRAGEHQVHRPRRAARLPAGDRAAPVVEHHLRDHALAPRRASCRTRRSHAHGVHRHAPLIAGVPIAEPAGAESPPLQPRQVQPSGRRRRASLVSHVHNSGTPGASPPAAARGRRPARGVLSCAQSRVSVGSNIL
ncbi:hypothetical protein PLANTIT3_10093 [Plantibacter sp. T3]|nr:hypothetical protein PLANTIT3_10093 [Plantibacter sp. T3]